MADTAFHRMAADFNNRVQQITSELTQSIDVNIDTSKVDSALKDLDNKFNAISSSGPENLQRAIQEATSQLENMLKALREVGNNSGLDEVARYVTMIEEDFKRLMGNSLAVKDGFQQMNETIKLTTDNIKYLEETAKSVNDQVTESARNWDQWRATSVMLKDDMAGMSTILGRLKEDAVNTSKAFFDIDPSKMGPQLADNLAKSARELNQLTDEARKLSETLKSGIFDGTKGGLVEGKYVEQMDEFKEKIESLKNTIQQTKNDISAAGLDVAFSDIIKSLDDNTLSLFNKFSQSLKDVPVEHLRELSTELEGVSRSFADLSTQAQNSDDIVGFLHNVLNGSSYSNDNSAYYVNLLSQSLDGLNKIADQNSISSLMGQLNGLGRDSSNVMEMQQALSGMQSQFKELLKLKETAGNILKDSDSSPEETTSAVRNILKKESEILAENQRALKELMDGMGGGTSSDIKSLQMLSSLKEQADKLKVSMSDLTSTMSKVAQENGMGEQVKQAKELADALDKINEKNKQAAANTFNSMAARGVPADDPFRTEVQGQTAGYVYSQNSRHTNNVIRQTRNVENLANHISMNEAAGLYGGARGYVNMDSDAVAEKARELQIIMAKIDKQSDLVDEAYASGNVGDQKKYMEGLASQQKQANNAAIDLGDLIKFNDKDLKNAPDEVKQVVQQIKAIIGEVKDSNGNVISIGKILGAEDATKSLEEYNQEFQKTESEMSKTNFWNQSRQNMFTGNNFTMGGAVSGILGGIVSAGKTAANLTGLGSVLSASNWLGMTKDAYIQQGRSETNMSLANLASGGDFSDSEYRDPSSGVLSTGIALNRASNGLIGVQDVANNFTSMSKNIVGQTGGARLTTGEKSGLSEMSALFQGSGLASSGQVESALNVYYKELGMNVKETEYQFSKLLATSQSLNIPFSKQLEQVTALAEQFKGMGLGAEQATNAYLNLTSGGMQEDLAKSYAQSIGNGMTNMNSGMLAYGGMMSGQYNDPFSAIADMKYGLWDANGNVNTQMADKLSKTVDTMANLYGGIAGGQDGAKRMIMGDFFTQQMGMNQQQAGMSVARYMQDPHFLTQILQDQWTKTPAGQAATPQIKDDGGQAAMDKLTGYVTKASDNLSGFDKTATAMENTANRLANANDSMLDSLTNYSGMIYSFADSLGNSLGGLDKALNSAPGAITGLVQALEAAAIAIPAIMAGLAVVSNVGRFVRGMGKGKRKSRGSSDPTTDPSTDPTTDPTADPNADPNRDPATEEPKTRTERAKVKAKEKFKAKGKGLAGIATLLTAAGVTYFADSGSAHAASDVPDNFDGLGGSDSSSSSSSGNPITNAIQGVANGATGGIFTDIYNVLQNILSVLSGGAVHAVGGVLNAAQQAHNAAYNSPPIASGSAAVHQMNLNSANYINSNDFINHPATDMAVNGAYLAGGIVPGFNVAKDASKVLKVASKIPYLDVAAGALDVGVQMNDRMKLNKMAGLKTGWQDWANVGIKTGASVGLISAGAAAGAAIGAPFAGVGAIPGAVIGGALGGGAAMIGDYFLQKNGVYDNLAGLVGVSDADLQSQRFKNSAIYRTGQAWADRYGKAIHDPNIDEGFAIAAGQGLTKYGNQLAGLTTQQKDMWAATYAQDIGKGMSEADAKKQADSVYQLSLTTKETQQINQRQLENMINQYEVAQASGTNIKTLLGQYLPKDATERNKILSETSKATGLSKDKLDEIAKSLGLTLDQLLAMISQSGGGSQNNDGFVSNTDTSKLRSQLKAQGVTGTQAENAISAYVNNERQLDGSNMSDSEKLQWAEAYAGAQGVKGLDAKSYADNSILSYRKDNSIVSSIKGNSIYSGFISDKSNVSTYLQGTNATKVLNDWESQSGMSSSNIEKSLKANGMNENQFASYLQSYRDSNGKWNKTTMDFITNGGLEDSSKQTLYTLNTSQKTLDSTQKAQAAFQTSQEQYNANKTTQDKTFEAYAKANSTDNANQLNATQSSNSLLSSIKSAIDALPQLIGQSLSGTLSGLIGSGGGGGGGVADPSLTGNTNVQKTWNYLKSQGYSDAAAAGVIGNFQQESGQNLDPTATNGIGAFGIGQWLGGRLTGLKNFAASNGMDYKSLDAQLAYYSYETTHGESGDMNWNAFKNSTNASEAASQIMDNYERPGNDGSKGNRVQNANNVLATFAGTSAPAGVAPYTAPSIPGSKAAPIVNDPGSTPSSDPSSDPSSPAAHFTAPNNLNAGIYDPYNLGAANARLMETQHSIYGNAASIAIGNGGINYQKFTAQSMANFQNKENNFNVNVKLSADQSIGAASQSFVNSLTSGIQSTVTNIAQKYASQAANQMGSSIVKKLRS